jgi:hypothetical protein
MLSSIGCFQKDLASVHEMESGDADLIVHEEVPSTPDEVLEEFFSGNGRTAYDRIVKL